MYNIVSDKTKTEDGLGLGWLIALMNIIVGSPCDCYLLRIIHIHGLKGTKLFNRLVHM